MRHLASRGVLAVLTAFLAVTTIVGALPVVPTLPLEWLEGSVFRDDTMPAIALGVVVGGLSSIAFVAVLVRPEVAGVAALLAGLAMIGFELVEILAVGSSLIGYGIGEPVAWLQVVYLAFGAITAVTGLALWRSTVEDRERLARTGHGRHAAAPR